MEQHNKKKKTDITEEQRLNIATNFFIGVTLLNETMFEVLDTELFKGRNKIEGKRLLNYFSPVEKKLFNTFRIKNEQEEEDEFQRTIGNIGKIVTEIADLNGSDIQAILDGIEVYKKELQSDKVEEITT